MNAAELLRQETNTVQLAPGEFLYREGDKADNMYVLLEGEFEIRIGDYGAPSLLMLRTDDLLHQRLEARIATERVERWINFNKNYI